jgi:IS1 family transposase
LGAKNEVYVATQVARASQCIIDRAALPERTLDDLPAMLDRSPQADQYFSDAHTLYQALIYAPGQPTAVSDKSQTYSVEADNAERRHYLARKSRCIHAHRRAPKRLVYAWNRRQMYKRQFPTYPLPDTAESLN